MHCFVKQETVLTSVEDDCHPGLAHFGNHQFAMRNDKEVEKNVVKKLESFFFDAVQPIQVPVEKPITKTAKKLIQQFFLMLIMRIQLGVENHETIFPTELIRFQFKKLILKKKPTFHSKKIPVPLKKVKNLKMKN